jgi:hypothetical protein
MLLAGCWRGSATPPRGIDLEAMAFQRPMIVYDQWEIEPQKMLTGSELLAKVKELGDASKSELVRECGYVSTKKDGSERLNFTAFYEALLEAKGLSLGNDGAGRGKGGRKLSYVATVQGNGNLLVGKAYTAMLDLKPGDEFEIKLGRKQIKLIPAGSAEEE